SSHFLHLLSPTTLRRSNPRLMPQGAAVRGQVPSVHPDLTERTIMKKLAMLILLLGIPASGSTAWAHGTVGDYTFLEPIVAEDANPKNEFDIFSPKWPRTAEGHEFSIGFGLEKVIIPAPESYSNGVPGGGLVSMTIGSEWVERSPKEGQRMTGFNDLE